MQHRDWNAYRFVLAVQRGGTLSAAARRLGVDATTVARRLAALQADLGIALFERLGDGTLRPTPAGAAAATHAEAMEHHAALIGQAVAGETDPCAGTVRLTSVPLLVNRLLAPRLGTLLERHRGLQVELIPDSRDVDLIRREADLALRLARPKTGGTQVKARRVGVLHFAAYASRAHEATEGLPWVSYDEAMAHLPQARWMDKAARGLDDGLARLRVHDAETALEAAAAGLGRTLLPTLVARHDPRLRQLAVPAALPAVTRELWLLGHADRMGLARISAVTAWLEDVLADAPAA